MSLFAFASLVVNLFLIIDPVGCIPLFATITRKDSPRERRKMIRRAVLIAFIVLAFFAIVGRFVLSSFGVSIAAVKIAGGVLLFGIGLEMLYGRVSRTESTEPEEREAAEKTDVSVTPLAIPLLAGPGSIAAVILFTGSFTGSSAIFGVLIALVAVMFASWLILNFTEKLIIVFGHIGIRVIARVMGLLLLFVATQFVLDGLKAAGVVHP